MDKNKQLKDIKYVIYMDNVLLKTDRIVQINGFNFHLLEKGGVQK
jgi:hypothetical protein